MSDRFWQAPVDFFTLVLIVFAGFELGAIGLFDFSIVTWLFGNWHRSAYDVIGAAALWQLSRQRFFG